jgi:hypothetical protein
MTQTKLKTRIVEGIPFTLHVADGRPYAVQHRDFEVLPPPSTVIVVAEYTSDNPPETITPAIPLLMVSGVSQRVPSGIGS